MATGGPLDAQRERRWPPPPPEPGQPPKKTVKVEDWAPEDESDYEDMETILGGGGWKKKEGTPAVKGVAPVVEMDVAPVEMDRTPAQEGAPAEKSPAS
jgi:hypothetical protein